MTDRLVHDPILCDAHGSCAELLAEHVTTDDWGYPIIRDAPIPPELRRAARRAVTLCPRLALRLERRP